MSEEQQEEVPQTEEPQAPVEEAVKESTPEPAPEPAKEPTPEPAKEPTPEPAKEPTPEPVKEPSPEPVKEPSPEPEEEVAAADMYKNSEHVEAAVGSPFDPNTDGVHPHLAEGNCKLMDAFKDSSTTWVAYSACSPKQDYLEFHGMGDSVKTLKESLDGKKYIFYILKCRARDKKSNVVSERVRCMRLIQLGSTVPVMKRRFKTDAWTKFDAATSGCSKDQQIDENDVCDWMDWLKDLKKVGGAHQPNLFMFGDDEVWNTTS